MIHLRLGIPLPGGALPRAVRELGAPAMVSANALRRRSGGFRSTFSDLDGIDVALDSAGFVAWVRYGGFPWSVEQYVGLAATGPWTWWAQMDACCEPEIASDRAEIRFRQEETNRLYMACSNAAHDARCEPPMPVLQGRTTDDYRRHAGEHPAGRLWPDLVGVGSMCRRRVSGSDGLVAVVEALDRSLPHHVGLHLFGVKSAGLVALARHPRVFSADSMAWDFAVRRECPPPHNMAVRCATMRKWYDAQVARLNDPPAHQMRMEL